MKFSTLDELIAKWIEPLRRAFESAFATIRSRIRTGALSASILRRDVESALAEIDLSEAAFWNMEAVVSQSFDDAGSVTMKDIPKGRDFSGRPVKALFNMRDPRVIEYIEAHSGRMITRIIEDQRTMVRQMISAGLSSGRTPSQIALDLVGRVDPTTRARTGGTLGLTAPQEEWVRTYREDLESLDRNGLKRALRDKRFDVSLDKAIREGKALSGDTIDAMVGRYRDNALRLRGETVAESEIKAAVHAAQTEAFEQAIAIGQVNESSLQKSWRSRRDRRVRDTHVHLDGQTTSFRGLFASSSGVGLRYPGDPRAPASETVGCRCRMRVFVGAPQYAL